MIGEDHVDDLELAAFVDGGLDPDARKRVEAHLLGCEDCRELVAGAASALAANTRSPRRFALWIGGLAAAAAAVVLMVAPGSDPNSPGQRTRDVEVAGPAGIGFASAAPPDGARIRTDSMTFSWTGAGPGATYQLTISTDAGAIVWSEGTSDTSITVASITAIRLQPGRIYYWQVDGVLPDLRSASTGPRRFETVAR